MAIDIETTGLSLADTITCIAITGDGWSWTWTMGHPDYNHEETKEAVKFQLDNASVIYAYNGTSFDLPFIQRFFGYSDETLGAWMLKLVDPLYAARALLGFGACPKLKQLLEMNDLHPKTASGAEAVDMAREGRWEELASYCLNDTVVTYELLDREKIVWTHGLVYSKGTRGLWRLG